jgi:hypothetical protein
MGALNRQVLPLILVHTPYLQQVLRWSYQMMAQVAE